MDTKIMRLCTGMIVHDSLGVVGEIVSFDDDEVVLVGGPTNREDEAIERERFENYIKQGTAWVVLPDYLYTVVDERLECCCGNKAIWNDYLCRDCRE